MPPTFEQSKDAIAQLVKHFAVNRETYRAPAYKEAHARQEFIDPFFVALGWDVHNTQRAAPDYREVVFEDSLEIAGQKKAPDYVFRVGRDRKFFAEAKKPGVDLKKDSGPAYQLRRYAWTAKLPLSILTDFEELAFYDCRTRPSDQDKASTARVNYLACQEYADRWQEVWEVFSREAVWGGSFDQYAQASKGKRGTSEVDAEFLKEIEGWRAALARNLALRNPGLSIDDLNDAVQRTIDRLIFLRMAEDRGIEDYGRLARLADGDNIYRGLVTLFRHADARYNSGLFDFSKHGDHLTPGLEIDDKTLKPILGGLYFPQSPYEFSVLPVEILGNVYEQFLGKVIRLTAGHQAKVEEKPEVKKAGGVYYTPAYIVEYIVKHTVGVAVAGKTPPQLKSFRVLDAACGSGSFLLGAYQYLLDYYLSWYAANSPEKHPKAVWQLGEAWRLTTAEKKRILTEHIFGVDIDRQAVEVTKLSLLLKVLETESDESLGRQLTLLHEEAKARALPNLDRNIKCGNSLIGPDYFSGQLLPDDAELRRVNPFDWAAEFPQVFARQKFALTPALSLREREQESPSPSGRGVRGEGEFAGGFDCVIGNPPYVRPHNIPEATKEMLWAIYTTFVAKSDLYSCFMERALALTKNDGLFGLIVPHTWTSLESFTKIREYMIRNAHVRRLVRLPKKVFANATVETCIFIVQRKPKGADSSQEAILVDRMDVNGKTYREREFLQQAIQDAYLYNFQLYGREDSKPFIEKIKSHGQPLEGFVSFVYGFKTADDEKFIHSTRKHRESKHFIRSAAIRRYFYEPPTEYVWYVPEEMIRNRKTARPGEAARFEAEKIMVARMGKELIAAYDSGGLYVKDAMLLLNSTDKYSPKYYLGVINSRLLNHFYQEFFVTIDVLKNALLSLPIRPINFTDPADKARHDRMVSLVEQMLDLHKRLAASQSAGEGERLQRLIDSTDQQIDALVYELYGLTPEEIAMVEGRAA